MTSGLKKMCAGTLPKRQLGQSLVGMAVALTVLVPFAIGVTLIGQYIHVKLQTQAAARQAAWYATDDPALARAALPNRHRVEAYLRQRLLANPDLALSSDIKSPPQFADAMVTTFSGRSLLDPTDLQLTTYRQQAAPSAVDRLLKILPHFGSGALPPNSKGLITAQVDVHTRKILGRDGQTLPFIGNLTKDRLNFAARTVVLADSWSAAGSGETALGQASSGRYQNRTVRGVLKPLLPVTALGGSQLSSVTHAVQMLEKIPLVSRVLTPGFDDFEPGRTAPDPVPNDKLVKYHAP